MSKSDLKKAILSNVPFNNKSKIDPEAFCKRFGIHEGLAILKFINNDFTDEDARAVIGARLDDEGLKYQKSDIPFSQWPEQIRGLYPGLNGTSKDIESKGTVRAQS